MTDITSSRKTLPRNEAPDLLEKQAGLDPDVGGNAPAEGTPVIKTREQEKTSLFDILGITKIVKLNQEHARISANLKRYQEIEKHLDSINARLDKIVELLTVATGGGQKNVILAAADNAESALVGFETMLKQLPIKTLLSEEQKEKLKMSLKNLDDKYKTFDEIYDVTKNISQEVSERIEKLRVHSKVVEEQHKKFWE